jgi:metallo-beta-lactamase class B
MKRRQFLASGCTCCFGALAIPAVLNAQANESEGTPQALEPGMDSMTRLSKTVWVGRLAPQIWLHTTTDLIAGVGYYPANGLILEQRDGSLLIDTGYRPEQAETLIEWSREHLDAPISNAVVTHFHNDRTGGIPALERHGIRALAHPMTCDLTRANGLPVPEPIRGFDQNVHHLSPDCELFFPGAGHTRDNIVVWFRPQRVLFGGCFLKSGTSVSLGNLADADVAAWGYSITRMHQRYDNPEIAVPGHGTVAGDPIGTTLRLVSETQSRKG